MQGLSTRDKPAYIAAACVAQTIAMSSAVLSPLAMGGLINGMAISEVQAGTLITVELLVIGITVLCISPFINRFTLVAVALSGVVLLITAHFMSAAVSALDSVYPWRILAGTGAGLVMTSANVAASRARRPSLLFGLGWVSIYVVVTLFTLLLSQTGAELHYRVVYNSLAVTVLLLAPVLWFLPGRADAQKRTGMPAGTLAPGLVLMAGVACIVTGMMGYYAFLERLAVNLGAGIDQVALTVILASAGGLVGGALAVPLAAWFGIVSPLLAATALHAIVILAATSAGSLAVLLGAATLEALLFIIMTPLMLSLAAAIDREGSWAAVTGGVFSLSTAAGPFAAAMLIESYGYPVLGWANIALVIPGLLAFYLTGRRVNASLVSG